MGRHGNSVKDQTVPVPLVLVVRCVISAQLGRSSLPAQHRPAVPNAAHHQLHPVMEQSNRCCGAGCQEGG